MKICSNHCVRIERKDRTVGSSFAFDLDVGTALLSRPPLEKYSPVGKVMSCQEEARQNISQICSMDVWRAGGATQHSSWCQLQNRLGEFMTGGYSASYELTFKLTS